MPGQLDVTASTVLDANGNGHVVFQPSSNRVSWHAASCAVKVSSNTLEPTADAYLGSATGTHLAGTYTGSNDSTDLNVDLWPGQQITVTWTGGDVGATASASLYGTTSTWGSS